MDYSASKTDVIILGGGLCGALTALNVSRCGRSCTLIEPRTPISGASINNAGGLYFQLQPDATTLGPLKRTLAGTLAPLLRSARAAWDRLEDSLQGDIGTHWTGGLIVALNEQQMSAMIEKQRFESELGMATEVVDAARLRTLLPGVSNSALGACYSASEGFCETEVLASRVRNALSRSRVQIIAREFTHVTFDSCFQVTLGNECRIEAPILVSCLGAFTDRLLASLHLPEVIEALPLQILQVRGVKKASVPVFCRCAGSKLSLKQLSSGQMIVGGGWEAEADSSDPLAVAFSARSAENNLAVAKLLIPSLSSATVEGWRGGWAAWTRDGLPLLGGFPTIPGFYLAAGGNGFTLAPLFSEILADLCQGQVSPVELKAFNPDRFRLNQNSLQLPPDG